MITTKIKEAKAFTIWRTCKLCYNNLIHGQLIIILLNQSTHDQVTLQNVIEIFKHKLPYTCAMMHRTIVNIYFASPFIAIVLSHFTATSSAHQSCSRLFGIYTDPMAAFVRVWLITAMGRNGWRWAITEHNGPQRRQIVTNYRNWDWETTNNWPCAAVSDPTTHRAKHLLFAYISFKCHSGKWKCYSYSHFYYQAEI